MLPTVHSSVFNGPLELLLELAEHHKVKLNQVSLGRITSEYMARVDAIADPDPDVIGDFVKLGARLTWIKSQYLLPAPDRDASQRELVQLHHELREYKILRAASKTLGNLTYRPSFTRLKPEVAPSATPVYAPGNLTVATLTQAMTAIMARHTPPTKRQLLPRRSLLSYAAEIRQRLQAGSFSLSDMANFARSRQDCIGFFIALLELVRHGQVLASGDGDCIILAGSIHA